MTDETNKAADELLAQTKLIENPEHGQLIISEPCLMHTCAWYVGELCAEYDSDMQSWMIMPYDRLTGYMATKEEAQRYLDYMLED